MTDTKPWYQSKLVWQNVIVTLIGVSTLLADVLTKTPALTLPGVLTTIAGVAGVILRVWYTDTAIGSS